MRSAKVSLRWGRPAALALLGILLAAGVAAALDVSPILARWSRTQAFKNDLDGKLDVTATYFAGEYVEAQVQAEAEKNLWTGSELETYKYTFLKGLRLDEMIAVRLEFDNRGPSMHMAPFDEQVVLWIGGKSYKPAEYDPRFNFKLQGKRDGMIFFKRYDDKTGKSLLTGVKSVRLQINGGVSPITDSKKIDFIWDVANDHPEKLYQGKAAERLELDRLIKRMEKLTQQKKDLEGQLAATLSELETIRKRMDELSK